MAQGIVLRLTHAGTTSGPLLISDVRDYTDGPSYAVDGSGGGGGVYVPESGTRDLTFTGDVARSLENGCIASFKTSGYLTLKFIYGTDWNSSAILNERLEATVSANNTINIRFLAPADITVKKIKAYAQTAPTTAGTYTLAVDGDSNNLLASTTFDLTSLTSATPEDLDLTPTSDDLDLNEDDVITLTLASNNTDLSGAGLFLHVIYGLR